MFNFSNMLFDGVAEMINNLFKNLSFEGLEEVQNIKFNIDLDDPKNLLKSMLPFLIMLRISRLILVIEDTCISLI